MNFKLVNVINKLFTVIFLIGILSISDSNGFPFKSRKSPFGFNIRPAEENSKVAVAASLLTLLKDAPEEQVEVEATPEKLLKLVVPADLKKPLDEIDYDTAAEILSESKSEKSSFSPRFIPPFEDEFEEDDYEEEYDDEGDSDDDDDSEVYFEMLSQLRKSGNDKIHRIK